MAGPANMRLCPNVPAQYAVATALGGNGQSIAHLLAPGGRLREQRDRAWQQMNEIPGVDCVRLDDGAQRLDPPRPGFRLLLG